MSKKGRRKMRLGSYSLLALLAAVAIGGTVALSQVFSGADEGAESRSLAFEGSPAEAVRFMNYHRSIHLTPKQEAIRKQALETMPAPCCSKFPASTCCCECNLAKTIWGLSNFLIAEEGLGAEQVRETVGTWLQSISPAGHTGDVCPTGRCGQPLSEGGCGGMHESQLFF